MSSNFALLATINQNNRTVESALLVEFECGPAMPFELRACPWNETNYAELHLEFREHVELRS